MKNLTDAARDHVYTHCARAVSEAGPQSESLFLARLALLLFEAVGDEPACVAAIDAALDDVPAPSLSAQADRDAFDSTTPHTIHGLHHFAWRCRDAEETRRFYEDLLELPLVHVIRKENVPSTGEYCPYAHIFFRMRDGSHLAFFDLGDDEAALPSPNTPAWVNHIAMRVDSRAELDKMHQRLLAHRVEVIGVTDHDGYIESIYFFDPNGLRLELTTEVASAGTVAHYARTAHAALDAWTAEKQTRTVAVEAAR
jgi:catechol 2,3-dioxygenase-like lactoylglutathione lyase family enzyme